MVTTEVCSHSMRLKKKKLYPLALVSFLRYQIKYYALRHFPCYRTILCLSIRLNSLKN